MQLRRFRAPSIAEAYSLVRQSMGENAVIVSTTNASPLVPEAQRVFEIVAGLPEPEVGEQLVQRTAESVASAAPTSEDAAGGADVAPPFVNPLAGAWKRGEDAPSARIPRESLAALAARIPLESSAEVRRDTGSDAALLTSIAEHVLTIEQAVHRMAADRVHAQVESGPAPLREVQRLLLEQGVSERVLMPLLDRVASALVEDADGHQVLRLAERTLAAQLPVEPPLDFARGPLAVFVVGPAGAGKTTFALRLGLDLLEERAGRVCIAGTDVARAGAPQQLAAAAAAAGLRARPCYTPGELRALIAEGGSDAVIVDTTGQTGTKRDRLAELNSFLQVAPHRAVLLAVPGTMNTADALRLTAAFAPFGLTGLVATHLDATTRFGGLVSAAIESSCGVAFTSNADSIRDGLAAGDNHALAVAALTGRWPERRDAPEGDRLAGAR